MVAEVEVQSDGRVLNDDESVRQWAHALSTFLSWDEYCQMTAAQLMDNPRMSQLARRMDTATMEAIRQVARGVNIEPENGMKFGDEGELGGPGSGNGPHDQAPPDDGSNGGGKGSKIFITFTSKWTIGSCRESCQITCRTTKRANGLK